MRIYKKSIATLFALWLFALVSAASPAAAQVDKPSKPRGPAEMPMEKQLELHNKAKPIPSGNSFYIEAVAGPPIQYSILITDNNNRSVPGTFIRPQIDIFEALLLAAQQFALTEEEAGTNAQPKVTRFIDKKEKAFIIDVQKTGNQSRFFVTVQTLFGSTTLDAGAIKRVTRKGEKEEPEPLFYQIITRVKQAKEANPPSTTQQTEQ
jgi:hypothetical protein